MSEYSSYEKRILTYLLAHVGNKANSLDKILKAIGKDHEDMRHLCKAVDTLEDDFVVAKLSGREDYQVAIQIPAAALK